MRDEEKLITIERYENGVDAELAKLALEQAGIACSLAGLDLMVNMPYPNVIAIELQVFERDAERAIEILNELSPLEDEQEEDGDEDWAEEDDEDGGIDEEEDAQ